MSKSKRVRIIYSLYDFLLNKALTEVTSQKYKNADPLLMMMRESVHLTHKGSFIFYLTENPVNKNISKESQCGASVLLAELHTKEK